MVLPIPVGDSLRQRGFPPFTWLVILICLAAFAWARYFYSELSTLVVDRCALVPADLLALGRGLLADPGLALSAPGILLRRGLAPLFGHLFLHATELHLVGNMLFLWVFGRGLERRLGWWRFPLFYLLCGLAAAACHMALHPGSRVPMVGASGAIAGILGGYLVLFPRARIHLVIWALLPLQAQAPAFVFILIWFLYQVANAQHFLVGLEGTGGIAYAAHCGGFAAGIVLIGFFRLGRPASRAAGGGGNKRKRKSGGRVQ